MKLIVGLGNPGEAYAHTRHNLGFLVADEFARKCHAAFSARKFGAEIAEVSSGRERVLIMKPQTYMNQSGEVVGAAMRFFKLDPSNLIVAHDDLELDAFRVQLKIGGGHGGHNGIRSINALLGDPNYVRVRIGVGRPPPLMDPVDYVLGRFAAAQEQEVAACVVRAVEAARLVVDLGAVKAMNQFNRRKAREEA
ncbi:MAG TPA: aminoacyl-tRNA hydrolase [Anaeromyxobacteraceae bacterium]|nr:aminoacyl-tRNA hydrolase [Anaeromyxobacteraceae bacterium]